LLALKLTGCYSEEGVTFYETVHSRSDYTLGHMNYGGYSYPDNGPSIIYHLKWDRSRSECSLSTIHTKKRVESKKCFPYLLAEKFVEQYGQCEPLVKEFGNKKFVLEKDCFSYIEKMSYQDKIVDYVRDTRQTVTRQFAPAREWLANIQLQKEAKDKDLRTLIRGVEADLNQLL